MRQFSISACLGPIHRRRVSFVDRSTRGLAQHHPAYVQCIRVLRDGVPAHPQDQHEGPTGKKLRVLAGDPPVDWSKAAQQSDVMLDRDASAAAIIEKEVLSKHRKALLLFGEMHLFHENMSAPRGLQNTVQRYEKKHPGVTLVIATTLLSTGAGAPLAPKDFQDHLAAVPIPSLLQNLAGTWLM